MVPSEFKKKTITATCSSSGIHGIQEVLKREELKSALASEQGFEDNILVQKFLTNLSKEKLNAYGFNDILAAANAGAVETLICTTEYIHSTKESENYEQLDSLFVLVENTKGKIHIVNEESDAGKKVKGLGGIISILRYDY